jgi:hypothetical protein
MGTACYDNYPIWIVMISNLNLLLIYILGACIIYGLGLIFALLYLLYCLFLEIRLLKNGCVNCYYYGKTCGFGKGRLSALFFKKGDISKFNEKEIGWKEMIPDLIVPIFPLIAGIIIIVSNFSWNILISMIIIILLSMAGNALIRGYLTCGKCKQRELDCPAEKLFQNE